MPASERDQRRQKKNEQPTDAQQADSYHDAERRRFFFAHAIRVPEVL